jgi:acyl transferase domain-containing protein/acyl carrier protein
VALIKTAVVAQEQLIRETLQKANLLSTDIDYVETHGTGTKLGDPIEVGSLGVVLGENRTNPLYIGTVKTNIGHLEESAGVAGVIKTVLMLKNKQIVPNLHFSKLNPMINLDVIPAQVPVELLPWPENDRPKRAGVSSFGFSGINAHIIIEEAPVVVSQADASIVERGYSIVPISAKGEDALAAQIASYLQFITAHPEHSIEDIACSAATSRAHFKDRITLIGRDRGEILACVGEARVGEAGAQKKLTFIFSDNVQSQETHGEFYLTNKIYQTTYDEAIALFAPEHKENSSSTIFASTYALYKLWGSYGVRPDYLLGHGALKYLAAVVAGVMRLEDAVLLTSTTIAELEAVANSIDYKAPEIVMISSVTGEKLSKDNINAAYFEDQAGLEANSMEVAVILEKLGSMGIELMPTLRSGFDFGSGSGSGSGGWNSLFTTLAQLYTNGYDIDWEQAEAPYKANRTRVSLPHYPFQRQRYWASELERSGGQILEQDLLYNVKWEAVRLTTNHTKLSGKWLSINHDTLELDVELIRAKPSDDFDVLIAAHPDLTGVLYCVPQSANEADNTSRCQGFFNLTQALLRNKSKATIIVISCNAQHTGRENELDLTASLVLGLAKALAYEYPQLTLLRIDFDGEFSSDVIAKEYGNLAAQETQVAYRKGKRYLPYVVQSKFENAADDFSFEGTWLLCGGMGGIGQYFTQWLVEHGVRSFIFTGRKILGDSEKAIIAALQGQGVEVKYLQVDISQEEEVKQLFVGLEGLQIAGLIHLAGIDDRAAFVDYEWERFEQVLKSKVQGGWYLHKYGTLIPQFILVSSIASVIGSNRQAAYVTANSYLDDLSFYRNKQGLKTLLLNFGPWNDTGLTAESEYNAAYLNQETALNNVEYLLKHNIEQCAIVEPDYLEFMLSLLPRPLPAIFSKILGQERLSDSTLLNELEEASSSDREEILRSYLTNLLKTILKFKETQELGDTQGFFEMGMDSLMAVSFKNQLQQDLGNKYSLSNTLAFDYPNINLLVTYLKAELQFEQRKAPIERVRFAQVGEAIAIVAMACRLPGNSNSPEEFWDMLNTAKDVSSLIPEDRFDAEQYYDPDQSVENKSYTKWGHFIENVKNFDAGFLAYPLGKQN